MVIPHESTSVSFMGLTLPLFSYSYALFCSRKNAIPILFSIFRTLWQKHSGGEYPLQSENLSCSAFDPVSLGIGTYEQTLVPRSYRFGRFGWDSQRLSIARFSRYEPWLSSSRFHRSRITGHGPRVTGHKSLSPVESALTQNTPVTALDSALPKHST